MEYYSARKKSEMMPSAAPCVELKIVMLCEVSQKEDSNFPGGPVAKTLHSQCRGPGFDPWSGDKIPHVTTKDLTYCKED